VIETSTAIEIARPVAVVFAFLADFENDPRWRPDVSELVRLRGSVDAPGAVYRQVLRAGGRRIVSEFTVAELEPGRRLVYASTRGPVEFRGAYAFTALDPGRTRIAFEGSIALRGLLRVAEGLLRSAVEREGPAYLSRLKALLEADATAR
jgi:uncharacterized membrane protein